MWFEQKHLGAFVLYLLVAVAMVSVSGTNDTWAATDQMGSVLYLKNGSVIHGVIVEQVIGKSVKIQTRAGNILKFQVDEIEKISTERLAQQSLKWGSRKDPTAALGISLVRWDHSRWFWADLQWGIRKRSVIHRVVSIVARGN